MKNVLWLIAGVKLFLFGLLFLYLEMLYGYGQGLAAMLGKPSWTGYVPTALYLLLSALCTRRAITQRFARKRKLTPILESTDINPEQNLR